MARRPSARCREYTPWIVNSNMHCWYQLMVFRGGEGLVLFVARQLERPLLDKVREAEQVLLACASHCLYGRGHRNLRVLPIVGPSHRNLRVLPLPLVQVVMSTMVEWSTLPQESALLAKIVEDAMALARWTSVYASVPQTGHAHELILAVDPDDTSSVSMEGVSRRAVMEAIQHCSCAPRSVRDLRLTPHGPPANAALPGHDKPSCVFYPRFLAWKPACSTCRSL